MNFCLYELPLNYPFLETRRLNSQFDFVGPWQHLQDVGDGPQLMPWTAFRSKCGMFRAVYTKETQDGDCYGDRLGSGEIGIQVHWIDDDG